MTAKLRAFWLRIPFRHMTVLVLALWFIKEQFPFSAFPMYSDISSEADVIYVTDQKDQVIPMDETFGTRSAQTKKTYNADLHAITAPKKRSKKAATDEERSQAGKEVLDDLVKRVKRKKLAPEVTGLRLYLRTFSRDNGVLQTPPPRLLAEQSL